MRLENLVFDSAILLNLVTALTSFRVDPYFSTPENDPLVTSRRQNSFSSQVSRRQTQSNVQPFQNYYWFRSSSEFQQQESRSGFQGHSQVLMPQSSENFFVAAGEEIIGGNSFKIPNNQGGKNVDVSYSSQKNEWKGSETHKTPKTIYEMNDKVYRGSGSTHPDSPDRSSVKTREINSTSDKVGRNIIPNKHKRLGPSIAKPQGGQIVFPDGFTRQNFTPSKFDCTSKSSSTFCEQVGDDYPTEYINQVLRKEGVKFREFFGQEKEFVPESNITERINFAEEDYLCPYKQEIIYPKAGKNKDNKWLFIVNHDKYLQGVKVELCLHPNKQCSLTEGFPLGYTTYCKQKYIERKMVALGEEGKPRSDYFVLPSCCSCVVKYNSPSARISSSLKKKPARKTG